VDNRIEVIVDSRLRVRRADLPDMVASELVTAFTYQNPEFSKKRAMGFSTYGVPLTVSTCASGKEWITLPRGGTQKVRAALAMYGLKPTFVDKRLRLPYIEMPKHQLMLRPYQQSAVERMIERENCLLRAPTGSGKTSVAIALIARLGQPSLVILWSSNLLEQWRARLTRELGLRDKDIGVVRGSRAAIRPITLAMQQTLWSRDLSELSSRFGLVVVDEVQRVAARTFRDVVDAFPARYRFGISADERRKDRMDFLTRDLFGPPAADIPLEELVEEGSVHDVEILVVPTEFRADWYGGDGDIREAFDFNRLLEEMTHDDARNAQVAGRVRESVAEGHPTLVFTHRVEHARFLADEVLAGEGCGLLLGGPENSVRFEEDRRRLLDGKAKSAVGTVQAIGQGLDLPSVSRGVVSTPIAGNRQVFGQVRGRICRTSEGKEDAALYYLWDQHVYPKHLKNMVAWNATVKVLDGCEWVEGEEYLRRHESEMLHRERERRGKTPVGSPLFEDE
jgi:superfamily II DNA or RNA helicase